MPATISGNAMTILEARYLDGDSVDSMWDRVSGGNEKYRRLMSELRFLPNSPTLFNMGKGNNCTSSACFVFEVDDEMGPLPTDNHRSIVNTRAKAIAVAKAGGGVGYYFGNLRPKGSFIRSIHRKACGPVAVLKDYHAVHKLITQGGKRDLAQMGVLNVEHPDIMEFIHTKDEDPQSLSSFNISVSWPCSIMADRSGKWDSVWQDHMKSAWRTGCPGILFPDIINRFNPNPHLGIIKATNPCVTGDTVILVKNGWKRIADVVNTTVEVWNGLEWSSVVPRVTGYNQDVVRVMFRDGRRLDCTPYHLFYLDSGLTKTASQLVPGECLEEFKLPNDEIPHKLFVAGTEKMAKADVVYCFKELKRGRGVFNGVLTSQCGETPNRDSEPCNLGSLSLPKYFSKGNRDVDWKLLEEDAYVATEFLDDILDRNEFPHPEITKAALLTRKLGLGVMGWADLLSLMHIHYDTQKAVDLGETVMKLINDVALQASIDMGKKKGTYAGYDPVKTQGPFCRNETRTSIAPTGTIALIADVFGSIEPFFALEWDRTTGEGIKMKEKISCWDGLEGFVPKIASEISPEWHVKHQAAFQRHTNLGVSKTTNLPNSATVEDVSNIYKMMWESGCKGGTVFRDGCRSEQVLVSKKTTSVFSLNGHTPVRRKMPPERGSITHKFKVSGTECFLTVGLFEDGKTPGEMFLRASKMGSTIGGILDTWAITFSLALQSGTSLETLCKHHAGTRFEPHGMTDNPSIPVCTSIPDYVVRWLFMKFLAPKISKEVKQVGEGSGIYCPECDREVVYLAGCLTCLNKSCNWSRCG